MTSHRDAPVWALYDLSLPGRTGALEAEAERLRREGVRVIVLGRPARDADVFLDGREIERRWLARPEFRNPLCDLRTELASAVGGERFLRAARRAVAVAAEGPPPARLVAAGADESVTAWLAARLMNVPFIASVDGAVPPWAVKLVDRIRGDALEVRGQRLEAPTRSAR